METIKPFLRQIWNSPWVFSVRALLFNLSEWLTGYYFEKKRFSNMMGYVLDLKTPKSFSHHLVWKKIYDRNPILITICDKFRVRQYLVETLGKERADKILIPLLYSTDNPDTIPFDRLEGEYIIKANHNSGPNFMVKTDHKIDRSSIISNLKEQLKRPYGVFKHEWAYGKIKKRLVIVEKLIKDEGGNIPEDYKFHIIRGKCAFIQVDYDRFTDHSRSLYDRNWDFIPATLKFKQGPKTTRPARFAEMLSLAEKLSIGFDYVRIDLYNIGDRIYFGEMTNYPGSGMERFTPESYDFEFGKLWK